MSIQTTGGPLNTAQIDSVTHTDHDHRQLWDQTNLTLGQNSTLIAAHDAAITKLQAQIAALMAKTS